MSPRAVETLLARLLSDESLRERFLAQPVAVALEAGLTAEEAVDMARMDPAELGLQGESVAFKTAPGRRKLTAS